MGIAIVWEIVKTAATKIPWSKIAQNSPVIMDMLGMAKVRMAGASKKVHDDHDQLLQIQEENARLAKCILELTDQLQNLNSRVSLLSVISGVSLLIATSSLIVWALK